MDKQSLKCLTKAVALGVVLGTALTAAQPVSAELKSTFANKKPAVTAWGEGAIANDYLTTVAKQVTAPAVKKEVPVVKKAAPAVKKDAPVFQKRAVPVDKKNVAFGKAEPVKVADDSKLFEKMNGLNAENAKLSEKVKTLNVDNAKMVGDMKKLTEDNAKLTEKVAALEAELKDLKFAVAQQNVQMVKMMNKQDMKFTEMKLEQDGKIVNLMYTVEKAMKK